MIRHYVLVLALVGGSMTLAAPVAATQQKAAPQSAANDISGTYSFLRDGEFVQLTVEDGRLSGYVSRFGDSDSDKGQFIDHQ